MLKTRLIVATIALTACTEKANLCSSDSDCKDVAYPFCDVAGEYSASGGEKQVCTIVPPDCPVERCGCTAGATSCMGDELVVCNTDGMSQSTTTCVLGCVGADHCGAFVPSNGLDTVFTSASSQPDIEIANGAVINTDTGTITGGTQTVENLIVSRASGNIRVFVAKSFTIHTVNITGTLAAAFVAGETITIDGTVVASASGTTPGPGGQRTPSLPCQGMYNGGGGGGGNDIAGGAGYSKPTSDVASLVMGPGGVALPPLTDLVGGCYGGGTGTSAFGGAGGGAVQFVAGTSMQITSTGVLTVGGTGGLAPSNGGGSGGNVIIEAPIVTIAGGIAANGGGGAGCGNKGDDAIASTSPASGGHSQINMYCGGGRGGTGTLAAAQGGHNNPDATAIYSNGGGGSVGRVRIVTRDGMYGLEGSGFVSAGITKAQLQLH